ncbi:oligosaccharide flippase family protein [Nocardioides panaciterrulae]
MIASFGAIPVVARHCGSQQWAGLAIGLSVGACAAIFVNYGWSLTGPSAVAQSDWDERRRLYADSLAVRSLVFALVAPPAILLATFLAPAAGRSLSAIAAAGSTFNGMSIAWYCIGMGEPAAIAIFELFPRILAAVVAAGCIGLGGPVELFPATQFVAVAAGVGTHAGMTLRRESAHPRGHLPKRLGSLLVRGFPAMVVEGAAGLYASAAAAIVSTQAAPASVSSYSSGDRLYRIGLSGLSAVSNANQSWIAETTGATRGRRALRSMVALSLAGAMGMITLAWIGTPASHLIFGPHFIKPSTSLAFGICFFAVAVNTGQARFVLAPSGRTRELMIGTFAGAATGVPAIALGAGMAGAAGAAFGLAVSQVVVCATLAYPTARVLKSLYRENADQELVGTEARD